jgi:transcription antitermination factor NusG
LLETEIASLQTAFKAQIPLLPFPFIQVGNRVRIEAGVLSGVVGIVVRIGQATRLVLSVTLLHRSVLLEVDRSDIYPEPEHNVSVAHLGSWYLASI